MESEGVEIEKLKGGCPPTASALPFWALDRRSRARVEDDVGQDGKAKNMEPKHKSANHDHPAIALGLRNLCRLLPVNPICHPHVSSGRESLPVAAAIGSYRKQPKQDGNKRYDDDSDEH